MSRVWGVPGVKTGIDFRAQGIFGVIFGSSDRRLTPFGEATWPDLGSLSSCTGTIAVLWNTDRGFRFRVQPSYDLVPASNYYRKAVKSVSREIDH